MKREVAEKKQAFEKKRKRTRKINRMKKKCGVG